MKRPMHILTLTTLIAGAALIIALLVSPADGSRCYAIESGDIAFVDVFTLIDRALLAQDMADVRTEFNAKSTESIGALQQQLQNLQTTLSTMTQDDPNAATAYSQYQNVQYQLENMSRQINEEYQTLVAQQIAQGYREIYAAANEVGLEAGFTFVFATRSSGELLQTDTITGITQEILARPLLTPPGSVDLTEQVRIRLGYPEKAPEPEADVEAQDPAEQGDTDTDAPVESSADSPTDSSTDDPMSEDD